MIWAQAKPNRGAGPTARQRYPNLPKWLFDAGALKEPHALWSDADKAWEYQVRAGTQYYTLTGATLLEYASAYRDITKMPLALPGGSGG